MHQKIFRFLPVVVLAISAFGCSENWEIQPTGARASLHNICFSDPDNGWVGGDWGHLASTTDGGRTWQRHKIPKFAEDDIILSVEIVDASNGWISTMQGNLLATNDGGQSWTKQLERETARWLNKIDFVDREIGWAVGKNGAILKTSDGGETWESQQSGVSDDLLDISFADRDIGWITADVGWLSTGGRGEAYILYTDNGGATWKKQSNGFTDFIPDWVSCVSKEESWVAGVTRGGVFRTLDGGSSWEQMLRKKKGIYFKEIHFIDSKTGWVAGQVTGGRTVLVYSTEDGGNTWKRLRIRKWDSICSMAATSDGTLHVVDINNVYTLRPQP